MRQFNSQLKLGSFCKLRTRVTTGRRIISRDAQIDPFNFHHSGAGLQSFCALMHSAAWPSYLFPGAIFSSTDLQSSTSYSDMSGAIGVLEKGRDPVDARSRLFAFVRPPGHAASQYAAEQR